jgi:hypothetical protein
MEQPTGLVPQRPPSVFVAKQVLVGGVERIDTFGISLLDDLVVPRLLCLIKRGKSSLNDHIEHILDDLIRQISGKPVRSQVVAQCTIASPDIAESSDHTVRQSSLLFYDIQWNLFAFTALSTRPVFDSLGPVPDVYGFLRPAGMR